MNLTSVFTVINFFILTDVILCSRQHKIKKKFTNGRLSRYLSKQGRLRLQHQWFQRITDDEDLLGYEPGSGASEMQGDAATSTNIDMEDINVQNEVCCTLGRASSTKLSSCSARPYVRIIKQNIRQKFISEQLGLEPSPHSSDALTNKYKCILKHKSTFEKCCLASKSDGLHHKRSRLHHKRRGHHRGHHRSN